MARHKLMAPVPATRPLDFEEQEIPEVVATVRPKPEASPLPAPKGPPGHLNPIQGSLTTPGVTKAAGGRKCVLAIDPGPEKSAWVLWDGAKVLHHAIERNESVLDMLQCTPLNLCSSPDFAIEMIASYGMAVGASVFETCVWIGRFVQAIAPAPAAMVFRKDIKLNLCGSYRAKDANIRQALIDRLGPVGTKKQPGPLYGVATHTWAALAVAVTYLDAGDLQRELVEALCG